MRIASATEREEERRRTAVEDDQDEVVGEEYVVEDVRRWSCRWLPTLRFVDNVMMTIVIAPSLVTCFVTYSPTNLSLSQASYQLTSMVTLANIDACTSQLTQ
ncbi:hypothetical protein L2E82_51653 [Cichorium intybus]|nr:hypothetical protein L2E82_51653 [Cichorium intybus]